MGTDAAERVRSFRTERPVDLLLTLAPLRHGRGDPTVRLAGDGVWRATRTPAGPATVHLAATGTMITARAWGPGAEWAIDGAPELAGASDDADGFRPLHPRLLHSWTRHPGLRLPRTRAVFEALVPAVLEQKVTGDEARRSYRGLLRAYGERAPGPVPLLVPPAAGALAALPYHAFHRFGIEERRANVIRRVAAISSRLEALVAVPGDIARHRLTSLPGIGPWTAAETVRVALGDADAVSVGDYHVPSLVAWALAGERRGDDARMLELLAPYRGHRARVVRLLEVSGAMPPRRGPRMPPRSFATC